ncbi:MAG: hypothetical protein WC455_11330 [Dehalococcoidia bacterium]
MPNSLGDFSTGRSQLGTIELEEEVFELDGFAILGEHSTDLTSNLHEIEV